MEDMEELVPKVRREIDRYRQGYIFTVPDAYNTELENSAFSTDLDRYKISERLREDFAAKGVPLPQKAKVEIKKKGEMWLIKGQGKQNYALVKRDGLLTVHSVPAPKFDIANLEDVQEVNLYVKTRCETWEHEAVCLPVLVAMCLLEPEEPDDYTSLERIYRVLVRKLEELEPLVPRERQGINLVMEIATAYLRVGATR
jgi:hypothetical protein